jgi:hypothetical protein
VGVGEGAEGGVQCHMGRHDTSTVALGRAGATGALRTGEATRGAADDKWGRAHIGPSGQRRCVKGRGENEVATASGAERWDRPVQF